MKAYLTRETAEKILANQEEIMRISLDLGRTSERVKRKELLKIPLDKVEEGFVYLWNGRHLFKVAIAAEHYYKLSMRNGVSMLEID